MTHAFTLTGIHKRYPHFALSDINLSLPDGEVMGLVGVNGAGKSTLLRMLCGLIRADQGGVMVLGKPMPEEQVAVKRDLGFASEDMRLYKAQNLDWHMALMASIFPAWDQAYADQLLRRFDLNAVQPLRGFSHGQRVKAMLLLCFARRPRLLLLDEPTTGLDPVARAEVLEVLSDVLRDEHRSVLFSSHNTHDVEQIADSISFLHRGRLIASQNKERFIDDWRRVVCHGEFTPEWPEIATARRNGSLLELKVRGYQRELPQRLSAHGLVVERVDPMRLEDIFVTTVRAGAAA